MIDAAPAIWLPPKPAIIRPVEGRLLNPGYLPASRQERRAALADLLRRGVLTKDQAANAFVVRFPPALAMLMVTQLIGFGAGGDLPTLEFRTSAVTTSGLTTYSFASQDIGAEAGDRRVIVICSWGGQLRNISSATIGGVSATIHISPASSVNGIISALVPTGTTATIEFTLSGAANNGGIGVWRATGLESGTATDTDGIAWNSSATSRSVSLDILANGFAIAGGFNGGGSAVTFTNATEHYDAAMEGSERHSGGNYTAPSNETRTITINPVNAIVGASFR